MVFKGTLYYPSRTQFNDPFDCIAPSLEGFSQRSLKELIERRGNEKSDLTLAERREMVRELEENPREEISRRIQDLADDLGILSLSAARDNILMWSHYANSHQGFCLEFDTSIPPFDKALEVHYKRDRYTYDFSNVHANAKELLRTKYSDWRYEKEWRIISDKGRETYPFRLDALTGVIFGSCMSEADKGKLRRWIKQSSCSPHLYQAKLGSQDFRLDIERC
jgi:Protein of unknown function (DUF2971)